MLTKILIIAAMVIVAIAVLVAVGYWWFFQRNSIQFSTTDGMSYILDWEERHTLDTRLGSVVGLGNGRIQAYLGVPYAEPPVGNRRFLPPVAKRPWEGLHDATAFPMTAWQDFSGPLSIRDPTGMSEDCLFLNVFTPSADENARPVLLWIHGGSYFEGSANEYDGSVLAEQGDVVVVAINYRLGSLGFLDLSALGEEFADSASNGIRDQLAAIKWVRDNIADYGGDPNNITLFGESAGGAHVSYHIASPLSEGLFDRGIIQSGGYNLSNPSRLNSLDDANKLALETQNKAGVLNFNELKQLSSNELLEISSNLYHPYHPIVDGELIPDDITKIFNEGALNDVDVMIGSNQNEDLLYVDENPTLEDLSKLIQWYHPNKVDEILGILDLSDLRMAMDRYGTNQNTACPSILIARSMAKTGNHVYQYLFAREREGSEKILAYHGAEIPYVFNTHDAFLPTTEEDLILTEQMMEYWTEFAKKGTPNSVDNPMTWYEFGEEENYLILDTEVRNDQKLERQFCDIMIEKLMQSAASE